MSDYDFYGVDFEATPNFNGAQEFGNAYRGAFVELSVPNDLLISNPSPLYPHFYRINTGSVNYFKLQPNYHTQYYWNFRF